MGKRKQATVTINGEEVAAFDPEEFPGPTIRDPRVTAREDNWPLEGWRGKMRVRQEKPTYTPLPEAEMKRRLYCRDW